MNKKIKRVLLRSSFLIVAFLFVLCGNINAQITIDLSSHVSSAPPVGTILEWHNGTPASAATKLSPTQVIAAPAGTYYAVYHDTVNNCYSPESRVVAASNSCPSTTVDLTTKSGTAPPLSYVQWFTNNMHTGTAYSTPQSASAGTYYAFFHDSVNNCYSPASDPVIVFTGSCATPDTLQVTPPCIGCPVTACVVADDIDTTGGGVSYSACTAPIGYTQVGPDANGCVTITANPGTTTGGQSCVVACKNGICDTTIIDVLPPVTPDTNQVTPPCIGCPVTACVVADDIDTTGGGVSYSACTAPIGYTQVGPDANGCVTITANPGTTTGGQSCVVACKNGICDTTIIDILPPVTPDTNQVTPPCIGCPVTACVVADDIDTTGGGVSYSACTAPIGYTQVGPDANGCVTITANAGTTTGGQSCVVACKNGICDTTIINVLPPVTPDTLITRGQCDTCSTIQVCATANDLPSGSGTTTYSSCGLSPSGYGTQVVNPSTGCMTFTGNGTQGATDTINTCIVACKNGICDTSYVSILPPVQTDSITSILPPCGTCPTTPICPSGDDLMMSTGISYTNCGLDANEMTQGTLSMDTNGCVIWTPNGNQVDTITTCVIACAGGLCDTTYIVIPGTTSPLPVVLSDFDVKKDDCSVNLYWSTASELTTSHFNIMRRSKQDPNFKSIGKVYGAGTSSSLQRYRYSDEDLSNGIYEYKLQVVDLDQGKSESISKSVRINCNSGSIIAFPNPASSKLNIRINAATDTRYDIKLSDMSGRTIQGRNTIVKGGSHQTIQLDLQTVATGIYQVTVTNPFGSTRVFKIRVVH